LRQPKHDSNYTKTLENGKPFDSFNIYRRVPKAERSCSDLSCHYHLGIFNLYHFTFLTLPWNFRRRFLRSVWSDILWCSW